MFLEGMLEDFATDGTDRKDVFFYQVYITIIILPPDYLLDRIILKKLQSNYLTIISCILIFFLNVSYFSRQMMSTTFQELYY